MKIAIRYQSRGGNTKKVAEYIAEKLMISAESICTPIMEPVDLLIIGGGVYAEQVSPKLQKYIEMIDNALVKQVAPFCSSVASSNIPKIIELVEKQGIKLSKDSLPIAFDNMKWYQALLQKGKGEIKDKHKSQIDEFIKNITKE